MERQKYSFFSPSEQGTGERRGDYIRTDLACESAGEGGEIRREIPVPGAAPVTVSRCREPVGGAPVTTVDCGRITARGEEELEPISALISEELLRMASELTGREIDASCRVLIAGLGNGQMTPDAIGPRTVSRITVTRHLRGYDESLFLALGCCELSALAPGVLGQTGMETGEIIRSAAELVRPDLLVAVDALAARSCDRLASAVQISGAGISPGAGIGNHRMAITRETMGCPVLGLGVPTVVDSATLVWDALEKGGVDVSDLPQALTEVLERGRSFIVTPKDCDEMAEKTCRLLAMALDRGFGVSRG